MSSLFLDPQYTSRKLQVNHWDAANVPKEQVGSVVFGTFMHFFPLVTFFLLVEFFNESRSLLVSWFYFVSVSVIEGILLLYCERRWPAAEIPSVSLNQIVKGLWFVVFNALILGSVIVLGSFTLVSQLFPKERSFNWFAVLWTTFAVDFYYYFYHRMLTHGVGKSTLIQFFRQVHLLHHSVEELDFLRGNLSSVWDTAVLGFQWPLGIMALLFGMDLHSTFCAYFYLLMMQATHHVNHTFNIGFLRKMFVDNHCHKLHHAPWGGYVNHGACYSVWDRNLGTFYENWDINTNFVEHNHIWLNVRPNLQAKSFSYVDFANLIVLLFAAIGCPLMFGLNFEGMKMTVLITSIALLTVFHVSRLLSLLKVPKNSHKE